MKVITIIVPSNQCHLLIKELEADYFIFKKSIKVHQSVIIYAFLTRKEMTKKAHTYSCFQCTDNDPKVQSFHLPRQDVPILWIIFFSPS